MGSFVPAVKERLKARIALDGPAGSGKTWTALGIASELADGGGIALIDTEHESARLYANRFSFDTAAFNPPYAPHRLSAMLLEAQSQGYAVVVIDSLSHFWDGEGGTLEIVDEVAAKNKGNSFAGWGAGTPALRKLIDTILGLECHVIATMRSKMQYVLEDKDGKQVPKKLGLGPVMRSGIEFEFQVVIDMDLEHRGTITKSRCEELADVVMQPHGERELAATYLAWLNDGTSVITKAQVQELARMFAVIEDTDKRKAAKAMFTEQFGPGSILPSESFDSAKSFIEGLLLPSTDEEPF